MNIVIALAVLVWLLVRQLSPRPVKEKSVLGWIVLAYGVFAVAHFSPSSPITALDIVILVGSTLIGVALAALRAYTIRLRSSGGQLIQQGTAWTAVLWVVGLGQHLLSEVFISVPGLAQATLLAYFGLVILVQRGFLVARARSAGHLAPR